MSEIYSVFCATGEKKQYAEKWEAEAILAHLPPGKLPAAMMKGNQVVDVRQKPEPSSPYYDR